MLFCFFRIASWFADGWHMEGQGPRLSVTKRKTPETVEAPAGKVAHVHYDCFARQQI